MIDHPQWITWRPVPRPDGKVDKIPIDPRTGELSNAQDPTTWMSHAAAVDTGHPVGFVFTADDPFFFLDLDACALPDRSGWRPDALAATERFPGAMVELSHSGKGLHVFGSYRDAPQHGTRCRELGAELYTSGRFVALGSNARGDALVDCTEALRAFASRYFPPPAANDATDWTTEPCEGWTGPTDDADLIRRARQATSKFSEAATFEALWTRDEGALSIAFPDPQRPFDESAADAALARHFAFWTGRNCERIQQLMLESSLVRGKWDRSDYLRGTILFSVARTARVYDRVESTDEDTRSGYQFLTIEGQRELFAGCIYVTQLHSVCTPDGRTLSPNQFNSVFPSYEFARDDSGKGTTRKPWEAFVESLALRCPIADEPCFEPQSPWDEVIERDGVRYANTYRPITTARQQGDATPFLAHVERLLPVQRDRDILLAYMAAIVQFKGTKFQWCPLIQGVEGNGKTLLTRVVANAIGSKHTHMAQAHDISSKFNSWLMSTVFVGIEDVYAPSDRGAVLEVLKPMITGGDRIGIQAKGVDQTTAAICCNFMLNSNHRDALRKTSNDRRFAVFYTAQQRFEDLTRTGMGGEYFPKLYKWLDADGYAIVHYFLDTYDIPDELNPAKGCQRAPVTSTTDQAVEAGMDWLAQLILVAMDEDQPGFADGWVSRGMLSAMLDARGVRVSINKQREALEELGFQPHPGLTMHGRARRTSNPVLPDDRKAELWVRSDHPSTNCLKSAIVAQMYSTAQKQAMQRDY